MTPMQELCGRERVKISVYLAVGDQSCSDPAAGLDRGIGEMKE